MIPGPGIRLRDRTGEAVEEQERNRNKNLGWNIFAAGLGAAVGGAITTAFPEYGIFLVFGGAATGVISRKIYARACSARNDTRIHAARNSDGEDEDEFDEEAVVREQQNEQLDTARTEPDTTRTLPGPGIILRDSSQTAQNGNSAGQQRV